MKHETELHNSKFNTNPYEITEFNLVCNFCKMNLFMLFSYYFLCFLVSS